MPGFRVYARWATNTGKLRTGDWIIRASDGDMALARAREVITGDKRRRYAGKLDMMVREVSE